MFSFEVKDGVPVVLLPPRGLRVYWEDCGWAVRVAGPNVSDRLLMPSSCGRKRVNSADARSKHIRAAVHQKGDSEVCLCAFAHFLTGFITSAGLLASRPLIEAETLRLATCR